MASGAKRVRYNLQEVLAILDVNDGGSESDSVHGGMSSDEESEIDHLLHNSSEESR